MKNGKAPEASQEIREVRERPRFLRWLERVNTPAVWLISVLLLGLWGTWAGPGWNPQPMSNLVIPETSDTTVDSLVDTPRIGTYEVSSSDHELTLTTGNTITVRLWEPEGVTGERPGVVLLHGTGTSKHNSFSFHARWLSSAGIVTAVPDKPLEHYTVTSRDYGELASAYNEVADWLRDQDSVYERSVGYYGESEGALISPIAVVDDVDSHFLVLASDPVIPIREQGALAAVAYLQAIGAPEQLYQAIPRLISGATADGDFDYANFDPSEYHEQLTVPILMLYGTHDLSMPIVQAPVIMQDQISEAGNDALLVRYYAEADHGLRVRDDILQQPFQDTADFINGLPSSVDVSPAVAGAQPRQDYVAQTVDTPRWFGSGNAMLTILIIGVVLNILGMAVAAVGLIRVRGRRLFNYQGLGKPLVLSGTTVLVTWVVFIAYIVAVASVAMSYEQNRWLVQGGWLVVQLLALFAVWAAVRVVLKARHIKPISRWTGATIRMTFLGQVLLLFALAYWAVYPSIV